MEKISGIKSYKSEKQFLTSDSLSFSMNSDWNNNDSQFYTYFIPNTIIDTNIDKSIIFTVKYKTIADSIVNILTDSIEIRKFYYDSYKLHVCKSNPFPRYEGSLQAKISLQEITILSDISYCRNC